MRRCQRLHGGWCWAWAVVVSSGADVQVTTEEMRDSFKEKLTDAEDWLYMDPEADKAEAEVFNAKLDMLQAVGDPMQIRLYEMQRRPDRMRKALELTDVVAMATNSWPEMRPWLNSTRVEMLREKVRPSWLCDRGL